MNFLELIESSILNKLSFPFYYSEYSVSTLKMNNAVSPGRA